MKTAHYAGPVDGANTRDLLAGNFASAQAARQLRHEAQWIGKNFRADVRFGRVYFYDAEGNQPGGMDALGAFTRCNLSAAAFGAAAKLALEAAAVSSTGKVLQVSA